MAGDAPISRKQEDLADGRGTVAWLMKLCGTHAAVSGDIVIEIRTEPDAGHEKSPTVDTSAKPKGRSAAVAALKEVSPPAAKKLKKSQAATREQPSAAKGTGKGKQAVATTVQVNGSGFRQGESKCIL